MTQRRLLLQNAGTFHQGEKGTWNEIGVETETGRQISGEIAGTGDLNMISALMEKIGKL